MNAVIRARLSAQAQDHIGARWGIGLRIKGATDAAVDRTVNAASIVRTHVLRPTWHFVAAEDIRWLLAITGPRVIALNASMSRKLGLDARKQFTYALMEERIPATPAIDDDEARGRLGARFFGVEADVRFED